MGVIKGDTRSLDDDSYDLSLGLSLYLRPLILRESLDTPSRGT